jgi:hypothetical protein
VSFQAIQSVGIVTINERIGQRIIPYPAAQSRLSISFTKTVSRVMKKPTPQKARSGCPEMTESPTYQAIVARKKGATVAQCRALSFGK